MKSIIGTISFDILDNRHKDVLKVLEDAGYTIIKADSGFFTKVYMIAREVKE